MYSHIEGVPEGFGATWLHLNEINGRESGHKLCNVAFHTSILQLIIINVCCSMQYIDAGIICIFVKCVCG